MEKCQACGIVEGLEEPLNQVGDYQLCGYCLELLRKYGEVQILPDNSKWWLNSEGKVYKKK